MPAILFSQMEPGAEWEDEFNHWYNTHHVPVRLAAGFADARRYTVVRGAPKYAVAYYLNDLDVLETPAYKQLKSDPDEQTAKMLESVTGFTRYVGVETKRFTRSGSNDDPTATPYIYYVLFNVPADREAEFDAWYNEDHCPTLMECPEWTQIRRYNLTQATPKKWTHLAIHHVTDVSALDSPARAKARASEWRDRLAKEPWFQGEYGVYSPLPKAWI